MKSPATQKFDRVRAVSTISLAPAVGRDLIGKKLARGQLRNSKSGPFKEMPSPDRPADKTPGARDDGPPGAAPGQEGPPTGGPGPRGPAGSDLAKWLRIFHPAYIKFIVILGLLGLLMAALAFLDLQLLERLIVSLFPSDRPIAGISPGQQAASEPFVDALIRLATGAFGISATIVVLALYCPVLLFRAAILYVNRLVIGRLELASKNDLEREVLRNLLRKDDQFFQEHSVSVVTSRLAKDGEAIAERRPLIAEIWIHFVTVAGYFCFFITRNGFTDEHVLDPNSVLLTILGFGSIAAGIVLTNILGRHIKNIRDAMLTRDDTVKSSLEDSLAFAPEIQVSNLHNRVIEQFEAVQEKRVRSFLDLIRYAARMGVNYELTYLVSFVVFVYAAVQVQAGANQDISTYVTLIVRILPDVFRNLASIATALFQMNIATPSVTRMLQYASSPVRLPPGRAPIEAPPQPAAITMKGVTYRFSPDGPLQGGKTGIDLTITPGSLVAVVGGSGSGKTMLCQLILGRLPAESGTISFGKQELPQIGPDEKALTFAYMPQSNALHEASIRKNLLFAQPSVRPDDTGFDPKEMSTLERTGVARVALQKSLEMYPDNTARDGVSAADLTEFRSALQERVTKGLGVELVRLGPGQAAPNHPVLDHLLGGAVDKDTVLALMQSRAASGALAKLIDTPFGSGLTELALAIIDSTRELLLSCEDVEAYNRVAPYPVDARIWDIRRQFADMPESFLDASPGSQAQSPIPKVLAAISGESATSSVRLSLMIVGLLSCPNEFDDAWTPSRPNAVLPRPDDAVVTSLGNLLSGAIEPFQTDRINPRLCWRDNLLFGAPKTSNSRLQTEIDAIILSEMATHPLSNLLLACGFSYRVGRQGKRLSGGQRQRICLGRTLLQDVLVYILDEPSSALDPQARRLVNAYLKERASSSTIIAITHDRDLAQAADQVLMVHDGRLLASGKFETLMKKSEEFRRIVGGM